MSVLNSVIENPCPSAPKGIIYGPPGVGKAQPLDAKILTPVGFKRMADIRVGDHVIGSNGHACRVLGVYPQGEKEVFAVSFRDGSSTECCDDHLWFTQTLTEREQGNAGAVRSLKSIRATLRYGTRFNHGVPRVQPVAFARRESPLPVDPWLLGMYLGDGHAESCVVITNSEQDVQRRIADSLPEADSCVLFDEGNLRIRSKTNGRHPSTVMAALRCLKLDNLVASEKFVPDVYLCASVEDRLELLRGLLDSDGFVTTPGAVEYCTTSARLAEDVCFLIRSLGGSARLITKENPTYTHRDQLRTGVTAYRVFASFVNGVVPVASRKHLEKWKQPEWAIRHTIREVRSVGVKPCQCIKIDALDSLYVTDDFILTHNTTFGATAEASIIIDCENGAGAIPCCRTPYLSTWPEIEQWLMAVERDDHTYKTMVIDSIDWLLRRLEEHVSGSTAKITQTLNRSHGGYGAGKQVLKNHVYQQLLPTLDRVVGRGIAVVLLAHTKRTDITDVDGVSREKTTADLPDDFRNIFVEWSDFVCLARQDVDGNRMLTTTETPSALAKNRYGMPPIVPFEWRCFIAAVSDGLSKTFSTGASASRQEAVSVGH